MSGIFPQEDTVTQKERTQATAAWPLVHPHRCVCKVQPHGDSRGRGVVLQTMIRPPDPPPILPSANCVMLGEPYNLCSSVFLSVKWGEELHQLQWGADYKGLSPVPGRCKG